MRRSTKEVRKIEELVGNKKFLFPEDLANDRDPETSKRAIVVSINSKKVFIPVGEIVEVSYENFCVLKDCGIVTSGQTWEVGGEFDPFKND